MSVSTTYLITDPSFENHLTGRDHPESPERYHAILRALSKLGLTTLQPRSATIGEIKLCHSNNYIDTVKREVQKCFYTGMNDGSACLSTGDTPICPESFTVAAKAVGAVLTGIDAVMQNAAKTVFCLVRPPGHHAGIDKGMGFCLFNNAAIGARYAQEKYKLQRILIVDWDVHHGNGTQEIFYSDPNVFYFSTHQSGHYPRTGLESEVGEGAGEGTTLNCPIKKGRTSRVRVLSAFNEQLVPAMEKFKPELVIISSGFDAHNADLLGEFNLNDEDFRDLTEIVKGIAKKHAHGRIVSVLEGGYNLEAIASAAKAHVCSLMLSE